MRTGERIVRTYLPACLLLVGCSESARQARAGRDGWFAMRTAALPDERPQILNTELPFRYPVSQYLARVEGQVLLRLFVDSGGQVVGDSTRVLEASGTPALDSAALAGAALLKFRAARRAGVPVSVSLLFPVHFKQPGGMRLPADSL